MKMKIQNLIEIEIAIEIENTEFNTYFRRVDIYN